MYFVFMTINGVLGSGQEHSTLGAVLATGTEACKLYHDYDLFYSPIQQCFNYTRLASIAVGQIWAESEWEAMTICRLPTDLSTKNNLEKRPRKLTWKSFSIKQNLHVMRSCLHRCERDFVDTRSLVSDRVGQVAIVHHDLQLPLPSFGHVNWNRTQDSQAWPGPSH